MLFHGRATGRRPRSRAVKLGTEASSPNYQAELLTVSGASVRPPRRLPVERAFITRTARTAAAKEFLLDAGRGSCPAHWQNCLIARDENIWNGSWRERFLERQECTKCGAVTMHKGDQHAGADGCDVTGRAATSRPRPVPCRGPRRHRAGSWSSEAWGSGPFVAPHRQHRHGRRRPLHRQALRLRPPPDPPSRSHRVWSSPVGRCDVLRGSVVRGRCSQPRRRIRSRFRPFVTARSPSHGPA